LYPMISTKNTKAIVENMMNFITYCDSKLDFIDIAEKINVPVWELYDVVRDLDKNNLIVQED